MFALSPKARRQARIAGLVCAAYGTAMFATHAYVKARQSRLTPPVVIQHQATPVTKKHSPKQEATKTARAWGSAAQPPASAASTPEQTQLAAPSPSPSPASGGTAVVSPSVAPASTAAASATITAPPVIVSGSGAAPSSQGFIPYGAPGTTPRSQPDFRGPIPPGQRPPTYPSPYGNRPPPQMPRGAPRAAAGNHPSAPPPRHK
jgi:hypothetical protein